jgi:hypothetical protein
MNHCKYANFLRINNIRLSKKLPALCNIIYLYGDIRQETGNGASSIIDVLYPIQSIFNLMLRPRTYLVFCNYVVSGHRCDMQ